MILLNFLAIAYILADTMGHYYVAEQLNKMIYKSSSDEELGRKDKGLWHLHFLLARISVWVIFSIFAYFNYELWWLIGLQIGLLIGLGHEIIPNGFKINLTYEGKWDWMDKILIELNKKGLNGRMIIAVLYTLSIIYYYL
jgi:hypothetical protein